MTREETTANLYAVYPRQAHQPERPLDDNNGKHKERAHDKRQREGLEIYKHILHSFNRLEVAKFTLYKHHQTTRVDTTWAHQAALATEHTLAQFGIDTLILASAHRRMELAEVEIGEPSRGARCCTRTTTYARLQLWHFGDDISTLAQVVVIHVDGTRTADAISKYDVTHGDYFTLNLFLR